MFCDEYNIALILYLTSVNFRTIYLGETFSSYICVHNDSKDVAKDVTVKVSFPSVTLKLSFYALFL